MCQLSCKMYMYWRANYIRKYSALKVSQFPYTCGQHLHYNINPHFKLRINKGKYSFQNTPQDSPKLVFMEEERQSRQEVVLATLPQACTRVLYECQQTPAVCGLIQLIHASPLSSCTPFNQIMPWGENHFETSFWESPCNLFCVLALCLLPCHHERQVLLILRGSPCESPMPTAVHMACIMYPALYVFWSVRCHAQPLSVSENGSEYMYM